MEVAPGGEAAGGGKAQTKLSLKVTALFCPPMVGLVTPHLLDKGRDDVTARPALARPLREISRDKTSHTTRNTTRYTTCQQAMARSAPVGPVGQFVGVGLTGGQGEVLQQQRIHSGNGLHQAVFKVAAAKSTGHAGDQSVPLGLRHMA
jgi:hypothetical protein